MAEVDDWSPVAATKPPADDWGPVAVAPTPQQKAVVSANDNADDAAKAVNIAKKINVSPSVVQTDVQGYNEFKQTEAAKRAVQNPAIATYVNGNPMAAKVSNDDYDKLDEASQTLRALHPELFAGKVQGGVLSAIPEIAELAQTPAGVERLTNALVGLPYHLGKGLYDFGKSLVTTPHKAYTEGFGPGDIDEAVGLGIGIALGQAGKRGTVVAGRPEPGVTPPGLMSFDDFMAKLRGMETRKEIDDFLASKTPGPPGALLQITKAEEGAAALDKAVETAQGSKTKERSPDMFAEFANAHDAGPLHIDGQAALELYRKEGKVPAPDDGILGWVPDIAQKLQAAATSGGEITVPVGSYIAHIDPAVHEGLRESVRLHDDGVTLKEAETAKAEIEVWHGTPHEFEAFDISKIGMGEGAQSYGHGLYFAETRAVAEDYRNKLGGEFVLEKGMADPEFGPRLTELQNEIDRLSREANEAYQSKDTKQMEALDAKARELRPEYDALLRVANDKYGGQLYKVIIKEDPSHFIDWDVPFAEQSKHVQDVLRKLGYDETVVTSGEDAYRQLAQANTKYDAPDKWGMRRNLSQIEASRILSEAGIPGIKYLDRGSRAIPKGVEVAENTLNKNWILIDKETGNTFGTFDTKEAAEKRLAGLGTQTRNFVVFDDKSLQITEINGNPVVRAVEEAVQADEAALGLKPLAKAVDPLYLNKVFEDAKAVGITEPELKRYSDLIQKREEYVLDRAVKLNKSQISKSVTAEWKRQKAAIETEVRNEMAESGRYAVAKFMRDNNVSIDPVNAQELAPIFGYDTGQALLADIDAVNIARASTGRGWQSQMNEAVKAESARRMEERHGRLAENIAEEARSIALAHHSFDILDAEVKILAKLAKVEPPLTKEQMNTWAENTFAKSTMENAANYTKHERAVRKAGRDAEKALLKGDYVEAFQAKQRQMLAATIAKESMKLQKLVDQNERKIDRYTSEETIKSMDQNMLEQIRDMLETVGVEQQYAPHTDIIPLNDLVVANQGQLAVAPWLFNQPPEIKNMTVSQFHEFSDSLKSMEHVARYLTKVENAYGEALLDNMVLDAVTSMERFPFIDQPTNNPSIGQRLNSVGRKIMGLHLLVERAFDYTDKFNPHGPITEWIDRPLRDANVKEIQLTEQVVRDMKALKKYVGPEIMDEIPNNIIPDAMDKSGFLKMNRQNLRQLMLNMGNWSNTQKLVGGFGVNEMSLRKFVNDNALPSDVAWVNGIWKIFKDLKPLADEVHFKDTGVPVKTIEAVPWDIKAGALEGGYYPLSYDPYNSDIQGHIARPLFDKGYFSAATPHGYTKERTQYEGAIDLSSDLLSSKIQGMVHDIAFRLPVRNANKVIENQTFKTAVAQYWGKEVADLLPGWIRDIANSHNLDDTYAKGIVRASALIRQNVVNTLIGFNPSTIIKHGVTAAIMSVDRVGGRALGSALRDLGWEGVFQNMKELAWKKDLIPDEAFMQAFRDMLDQGERGEQARAFVLNASAVMRERQRRYDESIRGMADEITKYGVVQTLAEWRQRAMLYQRMGVAFSDQMSAMPTWMAAYKKAYLAGEAHADAVFIADKEVSRAHGSKFVGDRPAVLRTQNTGPGEFAKWFTQLMMFWNHQQNNMFQLAWDISAGFRGNPGAEPGVNAARYGKALAYTLGIILVEEMAGPAKDDHGHGLLAQLALAAVRYLGGGWAMVRELTHALASGNDPTTGMLSTLYQGIGNMAKDLAKETGLKAGRAKNTIRDTMTMIGYATGAMSAQAGRTSQFLYNVARGQDRPKGLEDWRTGFADIRQGLRTGSSKARKLK